MKKITGIVTSKITSAKLDPLTLKVSIKDETTNLITKCLIKHNSLNFLCKVASSYLITATGRSNSDGLFVIKDFIVISRPSTESEEG